MKKRNLILAVLLIFSVNIFAQRQFANHLNTWFVYNGLHKLNKNWSLHLEGQLRRADLITKNQQFVLRGGIIYHFNTDVFVTAGYAFVKTYPYGEFPALGMFPENRTWQQLQYITKIGIVEQQTRFRLEQRWVKSPGLDTNGTVELNPSTYTNRIRWMQRYNLPLQGKEIVAKSYYMTFFDEIMINFGENVKKNIFDQNRVYLALGYHLGKWGKLELGYLNQFIARSDGLKFEVNHNIQLSWLNNIAFK